MAKVRLFSILLAVLSVFSNLSSGEVSFVGEGFTPEPNQEITVQIQTDSPLFAMGLEIQIIGDANITGAMCEADCNNFGWDNGWNSDPYIDDANGLVYLSGVSWPNEANGIIGYIKFRYNSGQVIISISGSEALDINCQPVGFSQETLVFGQADAIAEDVNDVNLPSSNFPQPQQESRKHLMYCPPDDSNSGEAFSRNELEIWNAGRTENNQAETSELAAEAIGGMLFAEGNEPNVIDVNSDITANQIWTADNVYHITADVNVQALLVIEPGTVIIFSEDGILYVNNGGVLVSRGTPDAPIIYTTDGELDFSSYACAIYVESTASPATVIKYNYIEGAYVGIVAGNIHLDRPIEDNYLYYNEYGIAEVGPNLTDIINNSICASVYSGVEVYMDSDANTAIRIINNTCNDSLYHGIAVHGVAEANDAGSVLLLNNIVSQCCLGYGLNLVDGWMTFEVRNTGYCLNTIGGNKNWEFDEYEAVIDNNMPYTNSPDFFGYLYISPNCGFVDAGAEYIEQTSLIGTTTNADGTPDSNKIDLGFHHANWDFTNAGDGSTLQADYDDNFKVDFKDFAILANGWQSVYDINDLTAMANEWLSTISGHPAISVSVNGDANNLSGEVSVCVAGCSYSTSNVYIFVDGQLIEKAGYDGDEGTPGTVINTPSYRNGSHSFKIVVIDHNNLITLSENADVNFNNPLHCSNSSDTYEPNQPLRLLGFNVAENNLQVKLTKWDGTIIWSQQISGDLDVTIPGSVLAGQIYDMKVEQEIAGLKALDWEPVWEKAINKKYNPNGNGRFQFAIFLPTAWSILPWPEDASKSRKKAVAGIINSCEAMGIRYVILYKDQCTWENFARVLVGPMSSDIIYVYLVSRGGSSPEYISNGTAQRSWVKLTDDHVVSNLNTPLGGNWDNNPDVHSMAGLGLGDSYKLKMVWIDICFLGKYQDMANAWMKGLGESGAKQLYVSWNTGINASNESCFCDWTAFFFGYPDPNSGFSHYGDNNYTNAFDDACRWDNVCDSGTISGKVQTYGERDIRFTPYRYDFK